MKRLWRTIGGLSFVGAGTCIGWLIAQHLCWAAVIADALAVAALVLITAVTRGKAIEE